MGDHNYCPATGTQGMDGAWCLVGDENGINTWEYCDFPGCYLPTDYTETTSAAIWIGPGQTDQDGNPFRT